jgi:hypothetical protein
LVLNSGHEIFKNSSDAAILFRPMQGTQSNRFNACLMSWINAFKLCLLLLEMFGFLLEATGNNMEKIRFSAS